MTIKKPESFWDILIWVSVLLTVFMGIGVLLNHLFPRGGGRIIFILLLLFLMIFRESSFIQKRTGRVFQDILILVIAMVGAVGFLWGLIEKGQNVSWVGWVFPLIIIWETRKIYREFQKKEEEARKQEELIREPQQLLAQSLHSDKKALILLSNARIEDVSFEIDDRMILYSLPDGRFLVLFRKQVSLEDFLHALAAFRTEVDNDEDAVGFYGQTFYGVKPDSFQAFMSGLSGVCRVVPIDLDSASLAGAVPV